MLAGRLAAIDASGSRIAALLVRPGRPPWCRAVLAEPARGGPARRVPGAPGPCRSPALSLDDAELQLGRTALAVTVAASESPHSERYALATAQVPAGALGARSAWSRGDSDAPRGCWQHVASGGGALAIAPGPNVQTGLDGIACPPAAGAPTRISLLGPLRRQLVVPGTWVLLATDGRRLALARLDGDGAATGELALLALDGSALPPPSVPGATVRGAFARPGAHGPAPPAAWLAPEAFVLRVRGGGLAGFPRDGARTWTVTAPSSVTVGSGRLVYVRGRSVRAVRLRDGRDRELLRVPRLGWEVAAGVVRRRAGAARARGRARHRRVPPPLAPDRPRPPRA